MARHHTLLASRFHVLAAAVLMAAATSAVVHAATGANSELTNPRKADNLRPGEGPVSTGADDCGESAGHGGASYMGVVGRRPGAGSIFIGPWSRPDDLGGLQLPILPGAVPDVFGAPAESLAWMGDHHHGVHVIWGDKRKSASDLVVPLTGADFVFDRFYTSDPAFDGSDLVGENWSASHFMFLEETGVGSPTSLALGGPPLRGLLLVHNGGSKWLAGGPTTQYVETATLTVGGTTYDTYRLVEPGAWEVHFYRPSAGGGAITATPATHEGLLLQQRDTYGNTWDYQYTVFGTNLASNKHHARLTKIVCKRNGAGTAEAEIDLTWQDDDSLPNKGRLLTVKANRHDGGSFVERQRVQYRYKANGDGLPTALGTEGDLIEVRRYTKLDDSSGSLSTWRLQVTQYRYHGGVSNEATDTDSDGYVEIGAAHQLKMVLLPEQIEWAAEESGATDVADGADDLLALADGATFMTGKKVVHAASEVIEEYETAGDQRVEKLYVLSSCGCGGGGSQGLRLTYSYSTHTGSIDRTTKVDEDYYNGSWTAKLDRYFDSGPLSSGIPYLINAAIVSGGDQWVTRFNYDSSTGLLIEALSPAVKTAYNPAASPPTYSSSSSVGLAHRFVYDGANRLTELRVASGDKANASDYTLVAKTTYGSGSGDTRVYLPDRIERFRVAGSASADDVETIDFTYEFHNADDIAWVEIEEEAELVAENGPGGTYSSFALFDTSGRKTWTRAADLALGKFAYQAGTGLVETATLNAATGGLSNPYVGLSTSGWGRNGDGGKLETAYTRDLLGRIIKLVEPSGRTTYTYREMRSDIARAGIEYYAELSLPHIINNPSALYGGPARLVVLNASDKPITMSDYALATNGITLSSTLVSGYSLSTELSRSTTTHDLSGLTTFARRWHDIANGGYYEDAYLYDESGRMKQATDGDGTITQQTYDVLDRSVETKVGTSLGPSNMVTTVERFYDSGGTATSGVGNGLLTLERRHVDGSTVRDTELTYDVRGNPLITQNPSLPHMYVTYDNLNRSLQRAIFKAVPVAINNPLADRGWLTDIAYSQRGRAYRVRQAIDATQTSPTYLEAHSWFDEVGRIAARWDPTTAATKATFDGLGRVKTSYITDRGGDAAPGASGNHAAALALTGDIVLEQMTRRYIADEGLLDLVTTRQRAHTAGGGDTAALDGLASAKSIVSYTGTYYDDADRVIRSVNFGTNNSNGFEHGGSAPTITQGSPPSPSNADATKLVTKTEYNSRGLKDVITAPDEAKTKTFYDDLNRTIATVDNYDNATISWSSTYGRWSAGGLSTAQLDTDRMTSFVYNANNRVAKRTLHIPASSGDPTQTTQYVYGTVKGSADDESEIASFDLVSEVRHPRRDTGEPDGSLDDLKVRHAYNRQGEPIRKINQELNLHEYARDAMGRVTEDLVTFDVGSTMDQWADKIATTYDGFGRRQKVQTIDTAGPTVLNAVEFSYDTLWNPDKIWQQHDGDTVNAGGGQSLYVDHTYTTSSAAAGGNYSRLTQVRYPDTAVFSYDYGSGGSVDDLISRLKAIKLVAATIVEYSYVGASLPVITDYTQPDIALDYYVAHNGARSAGTYPGLDRFGRVVKHAWVDGVLTTHGSDPTVPNVPPVVELAYGYDNAGNPIFMKDDRPGASWANRDWKYSYDGLDRLSEAQRGVYNKGAGTISVSSGSERYTLDMPGNWGNFEIDENGDADYADDDEKESRGHNQRNEIESQGFIFNAASLLDPVNLPVLLNDALKTGSLTHVRAFFESSDEWSYEYDAWDRLVRVKMGADTRSEYEYNGLGWRTVQRADTDQDVSFTLDQQRTMYYYETGQLLQENVADVDAHTDDTTDRIRQYVWGDRAENDIVHSRENSNFGNDGGFFGVVYEGQWLHLTDSAFSSIAVVDTSAALAERVTYTPHGRARHHHRSDTDGDGAGGQGSDSAVVTTALNEAIDDGGYKVEADVNRDGVVDATDAAAVSGWVKGAEQLGKISYTAVVDAPIGFQGNLFCASTELYDSHSQVYNPSLGRHLNDRSVQSQRAVPSHIWMTTTAPTSSPTLPGAIIDDDRGPHNRHECEEAYRSGRYPRNHNLAPEAYIVANCAQCMIWVAGMGGICALGGPGICFAEMLVLIGMGSAAIPQACIICLEGTTPTACGLNPNSLREPYYAWH